MIPISSKEFIEYKDPADGVVFKFKPKTGTLEREMYELWNEKKDLTMKEIHEADIKLMDFINKILVSPKADYNSDECAQILRLWNDANRLTKEEKKS